MTENTTLVAGLFGSAFYCSYYMVIGISLLLPLMLETRWRFIVFIPLMLIAINLVTSGSDRCLRVRRGLCIIAFCVTLLRNIKGRTFGVLLASGDGGHGSSFLGPCGLFEPVRRLAIVSGAVETKRRRPA